MPVKAFKLRTLFKDLGLFFNYCLMVLLAAMVGIQVFAPRKAINIWGYNIYVVATDSMSPVIKPRTAVLVKKVDPKTLEPEMIITFYDDINYDGKPEIVTHYFQQRERTADGEVMYRTHPHNPPGLSDANLKHESEIIGKVVGKLVVLGAIASFFQTVIGRIALIISILLVFAMIGVNIYYKKKERSATGSQLNSKK